MAIFHYSIKIFSRGNGHSAVEKAAYRAGEKLLSDYNGRTYDYTRKGGVVYTEIVLPDHAPREYADRNVLWNAVERIENNRNSQLAREIEVSLPVELSLEQNISLAREYVQKHFVSAGMCADLCVHDKGDGNPHAHIMLTLRPIDSNGSWGAKSKKEYILDENGERIHLPSGEYKSRKVYTGDWNEQSKAEEWRAAWADTVNDALARQGIGTRIDHRSYERQGVDKVPSIHMGVAACQMERKGIVTERGDINRAVEVTNSRLSQQRARIRKAKDWLYAIPLTNAPTMLEMMTHIADGKNLNTRWKKIRDLQARAKLLCFLQENGISDIEQLTDKVTQMHEHHYEVANKIKAAERRLGTLTEHLTQYGIQKQHRAVYKKYKQLNPKKRDAFYNKHAEAIRCCEAANNYFKSVMNGRTALPIKEWKAEHAALTSDKYTLCDKYYQLNDELRIVESLRRGAENIMRGDIADGRAEKNRDTARQIFFNP